jgi:hypothetical protein
MSDFQLLSLISEMEVTPSVENHYSKVTEALPDHENNETESTIESENAALSVKTLSHTDQSHSLDSVDSNTEAPDFVNEDKKLICIGLYQCDLPLHHRHNDEDMDIDKVFSIYASFTNKICLGFRELFVGPEDPTPQWIQENPLQALSWDKLGACLKDGGAVLNEDLNDLSFHRLKTQLEAVFNSQITPTKAQEPTRKQPQKKNPPSSIVFTTQPEHIMALSKALKVKTSVASSEKSSPTKHARKRKSHISATTPSVLPSCKTQKMASTGESITTPTPLIELNEIQYIYQYFGVHRGVYLSDARPRMVGKTLYAQTWVAEEMAEEDVLVLGKEIFRKVLNGWENEGSRMVVLGRRWFLVRERMLLDIPVRSPESMV